MSHHARVVLAWSVLTISCQRPHVATPITCATVNHPGRVQELWAAAPSEPLRITLRGARLITTLDLLKSTHLPPDSSTRDAIAFMVRERGSSDLGYVPLWGDGWLGALAAAALDQGQATVRLEPAEEVVRAVHIDTAYRSCTSRAVADQSQYTIYHTGNGDTLLVIHTSTAISHLAH